MERVEPIRMDFFEKLVSKPTEIKKNPSESAQSVSSVLPLYHNIPKSLKNKALIF